MIIKVIYKGNEVELNETGEFPRLHNTDNSDQKRLFQYLNSCIEKGMKFVDVIHSDDGVLRGDKRHFPTTEDYRSMKQRYTENYNTYWENRHPADDIQETVKPKPVEPKLTKDALVSSLRIITSKPKSERTADDWLFISENTALLSKLDE